jgi:uncharacterized protein
VRKPIAGATLVEALSRRVPDGGSIPPASTIPSAAGRREGVVGLLFLLAVFAIAVAAGLLGSLVGLGGGIVIVPALTLLFGVDIHYAVGASLISVIATSSASTLAFLRERLCNVRIGMFLELATVTGALAGAGIAGLLEGRWLFVLFGLLLFVSAGFMLSGSRDDSAPDCERDPLSRACRLEGAYLDRVSGRQVEYAAVRTPIGLAIMWLAGAVSGLLGIGAGVFKVPAMDAAMRLPLKVSTATSNFMMGVTAAASAAVYFSRGDVNPLIAGPVALGVLIGARWGSRLVPRLRVAYLRRLFVVAMVLIAARMLYQGIQGA